MFRRHLVFRGVGSNPTLVIPFSFPFIRPSPTNIFLPTHFVPRLTLLAHSVRRNGSSQFTSDEGVKNLAHSCTLVSDNITCGRHALSSQIKTSTQTPFRFDLPSSRLPHPAHDSLSPE